MERRGEEVSVMEVNATPISSNIPFVASINECASDVPSLPSNLMFLIIANEVVDVMVMNDATVDVTFFIVRYTPQVWKSAPEMVRAVLTVIVSLGVSEA